MLVGRSGRIVFERAYGHRSLEPTRERTRLDTIYDLASLTKVVATTPAILQLVEQGRIRLGDRLSAYLPDWHAAISGTPTAAASPATAAPIESPHERITLRQLLTHTSGSMIPPAFSPR